MSEPGDTGDPTGGTSSPAPARPEYLTIGTVTSAHGLHGEVNVFPHTDLPERFCGLTNVWLGSGGRAKRQCGVERATVGRRLVTVKLAGVSTREQADALRGTDLLVPVDQAWPLPEGTFYHFELEGLAVYDKAGRLRGTLTKVYPGPANDFYCVAETGSGRETLLAAVRSVILEVDKHSGRMVVEWPEEY